MFFIRAMGFKTMQNMVTDTVDRFRFHPENYILLIILGLCAHYFGFIWAMTGFDPFYSDWLFFINLSLGFAFAMLLCALLVEIFIAIFAALNMFLSLFIPDQMMKVTSIIRFKVPFLGIHVITLAILTIVFVTIFLMNYTDLNWWQITLTLLVVPVTVALWGGVVYYNVKNHKVSELKFDLGEQFELSAETLGEAIDAVQKTQHQLETYLLTHLPDSVRPYVEHLINEAHALGAKLAQYVPEKEAVHEDLTNFQYQLKDLSWDISYTRYALPRIRMTLAGLFLGFCILAGYSHLGSYVDAHEMLFTTDENDEFLATPITHRGNWQVLYAGEEIFMVSSETLTSMVSPR